MTGLFGYWNIQYVAIMTITKAGMDFQDALFYYMADFVFDEMVPDT